MTRHRRLCALLLSVAMACAPAAPALAQDNTAIAVNTKDGSSVFKLAFSIKRTLQPVVEHGNAAVAYASCENCQTVAIAIQIVLVMGDVTTATPENVAIAINDSCTACETLASAYQLVLGTGGVVRLTKEGRRQIQEIRRALRELGRGDLSIEEIQARVDALYTQIRQVFATELELVRPDEIDDDEDGDEDDEERSGAPAASPEGSPAPEGTATPAPSAEGTATPEPTASATPEPTATATPEPTP